jgi:hypothetical protein
MVQVTLEGLRAEVRFEVHHVDARVSDDLEDVGAFRPQKFIRLFKCIWRACKGEKEFTYQERQPDRKIVRLNHLPQKQLRSHAGAAQTANASHSNESCRTAQVVDGVVSFTICASSKNLCPW